MSDKKRLIDLNLNKNEIQNAVIQNLATSPANPKAGQFYFNTTDDTLYVYDGTNWLDALNQGGNYTEGTGIDITGTTISVDFNEVATASQGSLAQTSLQPNDNISDLTNDAGYISGINSTDVTTALGYTPYNATNPSGFQANVIESIKVNGTAQTITSKEVDIPVPVDAGDVNALPDTTKYGATLSLNINSTTYVLTATLKDQDGNTLGTAQTVDLPIESVVVDGEYDNTTKEVVLELVSGSEIRFSVADLVSGLQSEITSTNLLDADLVDDTTSANKFVTNAQRTQIGTNTTNIGTIQNTLSGYGNIVTHNVNEFATASQGAKADTATQKLTVQNTALTSVSGVCTWTISNTLATADVMVVVKEVNTNDEVVTGVSANASTITIKINSETDISADTYRAIIIG